MLASFSAVVPFALASVAENSLAIPELSFDKTQSGGLLVHFVTLYSLILMDARIAWCLLSGTLLQYLLWYTLWYFSVIRSAVPYAVPSVVTFYACDIYMGPPPYAADVE